MVDLRIKVVWTTCQNDTEHVMFINVSEGFFTFCTHIFLDFLSLCVRSMYGTSNLIHCHIIVLGHLTVHSLYESFLIVQCHKRSDECYVISLEFLHVVLDVLCIRSNDRTVVVIVCLRSLVHFIWYTWVEDGLDSIFQQPHNVSV